MKISRNNVPVYKDGHVSPGDDGNVYISAQEGELNITISDISGAKGNVLSPNPVIHNIDDADRTVDSNTADVTHSTGIIKWHNTNQIIDDLNASLTLGNGDISGRKCQITALKNSKIVYRNILNSTAEMTIHAGETLDFIFNGTGWICTLGNVMTILQSLIDVE